MSIVLHLMPALEWQAVADDTQIGNPSLASEGFIHCTDEPEVMLQVANAFYRGADGDFVVLHIDVDKLTSPCIWEAPAHPPGHSGPAPLATSFPHIFGAIDRAAVVAVQPVIRNDDGAFVGYGS